MKFSRKIFLSIFVSTAVVLVGIFTFVYLWILDHHMQTVIRSETELATLVALKSEDYILTNERADLYRFYQSILVVDPYVHYLFVQTRDDIIVHTFAEGVPKGLLNLPPMDDARKVDTTPVEDSKRNLIYHLRIPISTPPGSLLHFGLSDRKIREELETFRNILIGVCGSLLAIVPFGLALFLSRMVSRPLSVLRSSVTRIGRGELDVRIHMHTGDEIEQLVDDINTMARKLEASRNGLQAEIHEREQAEKKLAVQSELLNNILNHVPHTIFWKDENSVYLGCNQAFAIEAGLKSAHDIVGKTDYELPWKKETAEFRRQCDKKILETGRPMFDIEEMLTTQDGGQKVILTSEVPLTDQNGDIFGVLGIFYDITERKEMEKTLKQTQKMEAIGTLAGGIAHDFNNILGSIIGYTELTLDEIDKDSPEGGYLQQVFQSAMRAKELVRQILTFSRKSREERLPIQLSTIVKDEAKLLRSTLPATIEIRQSIQDADGMVNADPTQMHQIVMNLCTNAAHAMSENGGVLDIKLSSMTITPEYIKKYHDISPGPFLELKISDTGTGIDSTIIHRIFEPFFTTKEKERGTGMGLAVVHGIIKDHGGDIIVESLIGKGSTFTVLLPRVIPGAAHKKEPVYPAPEGNERILLVDDEKSLLDLGEKVLTSLGYDVTTAIGSLEALETFRRSPDLFDIVITDQTMPHMTGYSLAKEMLGIKPLTRIILCTGYSDTINSEKVGAMGIKTMLHKPISKKELAQAIRAVLDA